VVNRYLLVLGTVGMLPRFVGEIHPKHRVPSNASVVLSAGVLVAIVVSAVLDLDPVMEVFTPLVGILAFAVLTMMFLCSVAVIFFFRRYTGTKPNLWVRLVAPLLAAIALLYVLVLSFANIEVVAGSPVATVMVICLMIGLPALGAFLGLRKGARIYDIDDTTEDLVQEQVAVE
jgi:amino acid transporter